MNVSIGCPYCSHKVWSGDAWKQHMHGVHSVCPWYAFAPTPFQRQQLVAHPDDSNLKEEMALEILLEPSM